jgi:hypothetical protein
MKKIISEGGLRDIKKLAKRYKKAKIYYHQDLDGVTTALGMKKYLQDNGIKVVDCEIIQYGDREFSIKKTDASGEVMPVLVDFAHGKPMFVIHTDHHDRQAGAEETKSKYFGQSRSNVATISQKVSPVDIFPDEDIKLISMVDSADFVRNGITTQDVINYIFRLDKQKELRRNKVLLGLVCNKLLLAFKNKPGFLDDLVMNCQPSLLSIYNRIKKLMVERNYVKPEILQKNMEDYTQQMSNSPNVKLDDSIIIQYGGGSMMKPGSYDRYTPFKNHPSADFLVIAWPMGLVQASCNPFKEERGLKGVNLGEIAQEVIGRWKKQLEERVVPLSTIKYVSEKSVADESVGFTLKDFVALFGSKYSGMITPTEREEISQIMKKPYYELSEDEFLKLDEVKISCWDLIQAMSGGHKCITNISGLNYLGRAKRPPSGPYRYDPESDDTPYIKFTKMIQNEFVEKLKEKITQSKNGN